jgi:hypothetical protein
MIVIRSYPPTKNGTTNNCCAKSREARLAEKAYNEKGHGIHLSWKARVTKLVYSGGGGR